MRVTKTILVRLAVPPLALFVLACGCASNTGSGDDDDGPGGVDAGPSIDAPPGEPCATGLGGWTGSDNFAASQQPPCGFAADQVPLFVGIGWDDNGDAAGMTWAVGVHKQSGTHATFFMTSTYGSAPQVTTAWKSAFAEGNEIGNHTVSHLPNHGGRTFTLAQWQAEIGPATDFLTGAAAVVPSTELYGFRTPYLEYNDATLAAVQQNGFRYDCSIEEGYEDDQDGSNYFWPYTLDNRSPGHTVQVEWMDLENPISEIEPHPGLWEMPVYAVIAPPDDKCAEYGAPPEFRKKLQERQSWFDPVGGKITGFDYNLWASKGLGGFEMTKAEFLATLKYTFDLRYAGNRAPFLIGAHTAYYVDAWSANAAGTPLAADRQAAMEEFVEYVRSKPGVRVASHAEVLEWVRNPSTL